MLKQTIEADFITAYKAKETLKKNTLGLVKSRMSEWAADKKNTGKEILEMDIIDILNSEVKKRNQAIEMYQTNGTESALENAAKEKEELVILKFYLPTQMTEEAIRTEISTIKAQLAEPGKLMQMVMKHFNSNYKGQFDNKQLQELLKEFL